MSYTERHLPHWIPDQTPIFVTFRLAGSLPRNLREPGSDPGPHWLKDPRVAEVVGKALRYGQDIRRWYVMHCWVVMPNHVHILMTPGHPFSKIMRWLKWTTAWRCNQLLGRAGAFWQEESYDHWVRSGDEFNQIVGYIESNPVSAGLVEDARDWPWSSGGIET